MLRLRCLVAALALLAALASDSWGQSKQPPAKASQQKASQQERGTEDSPVVVKVLTAEKPKSDLDREIEKQESDRQLVKLTGDLAHYTQLLFWATGLLALVTGGLLYFGFRQVRDNRRSIKAAEDSTRIAERALTELEAPFVFVKINSPGLHVEGARINFGNLQWCVVNHGRTPAPILEIFVDVIPVPFGEDPEPINPAERHGDQLPYGVIAPPNGGQSHDFPAVPFNAAFQQSGPPGKPFSTHSPFFLGFVKYCDIFENRFILGFCFLFNASSNTWVRILGDEYNYRRKE
jgi:hypothetical protein